MDHEIATKSLAAERYLLNELGADERDAFEEHYFDCAECAADVESGSAFVDGTRSVTREQHSQLRRAPSPRSWIASTAAAAALLCFSAYLALVQLPRLDSAKRAADQRAAIAESAYGLREATQLTGVMRGSTPEATPVTAGRPALVSLDIPPDPSYPTYRVEVRDARGVLLQQGSIPAASAAQSVLWMLPPLPVGSHVMSIEGVRKEGNRTSVVRYWIDARAR